MTTKITRRTALATAAALALTGAAHAEAHMAERVMEDLHFVIPGGAGGGWDGTARGTGEALTESGLVGSASYENMSGGGGGKAIAYMIENADSLDNTVMVNSTPIVIRSLTGVFPQSFRDLTLVAGTIGDYAALVVPADSEIENMEDLVSEFQEQGPDFAVGGGSVPGSMDHLVAAMVMKAAGEDATQLNYIPYDAGGEAMAGMLAGEIDALSTGFSEAVGLAEQGEVRIIGVSSTERVPAYEDAPTFMEQGIDTEFVNWRGFFAAPGLPEEQVSQMQEALAAMYDTEAWEDVRSRNGWVNIHNEGDEFRSFLEQQEQEIGDLMRELGFL